MAVAAITELEDQLSQARDAAQAWLAQCAEIINSENFSIYDELKHGQISPTDV
jgi:hypothetical protein